MVAEAPTVAEHGSPGVPDRQGGAGSQALLPCLHHNGSFCAELGTYWGSSSVDPSPDLCSWPLAPRDSLGTRLSEKGFPWP